MSYATTLEYECPTCKNGTVTVDVDTDGNVIGLPHMDCESERCRIAYTNGEHAEVVADAFEKDCEETIDRLHGGSGYQDIGGEAPSYISAMRDSGRAR
jgi:hypothetical protein